MATHRPKKTRSVPVIQCTVFDTRSIQPSQRAPDARTQEREPPEKKVTLALSLQTPIDGTVTRCSDKYADTTGT